jgi:hypothetical protein
VMLGDLNNKIQWRERLTSPDALAHAKPMPTSGTRVHVFYDRVAARSDAPNLLGYVLAHEIGQRSTSNFLAI